MAKTKKTAPARRPASPKRAPKANRLAPQTAEYRHKEEALARPDVGTQPQFRKKAPPRTYRYDSSLAPALDWDGQNSAREQGEALIAQLKHSITALREKLVRLPAKPGKVAGGEGDLLAELQSAEESLRKLKALSKPFLDWAGKAERLSFDVPTLPLFVHERLSTRAILETLKGHRADKQIDMFDLFADPQRSIHDQVLRAYEYKDDWVNRMILGDSLAVINSLLRYESLGGQVQMIYMDPPYGVKFGSNFQPFVRKRDVGHNDDEDMTREPEMVQAYRDTWELGLHSYLTYLRDRLLLSRDLLAPSGSIFVQISDENLHHVREVMDEVFGAENCRGVVVFAKTSSASGHGLSSVCDYLLWYARDSSRVKYRQLYLERLGEGWVNYDYARLSDGTHRRMTIEERQDWSKLPDGARVYRRDNLTSQRPAQEGDVQSFKFEGQTYTPGKGTFKTDVKGLGNLAKSNRLEAYGITLAYRRFASDFPFLPMSNQWVDTLTGGFAETRYYVVQTTAKVIQRCLLMTTDPGDVVLDPTCGSGTTAYVAEQWGRRWITIDTSRVPLALARQRLLTATFPWYELKEDSRGPAGGFIYKRRQNTKGEEVGGIVPHIMLSTIANNEQPQEEVLVDRPEQVSGVTRVSGPFAFEATIPTAMDMDSTEAAGEKASEAENFVDRMLEVLRRSPMLRLEGNRSVTVLNVRRPAKTLSLSAEAVIANGKVPHPNPLPEGEGEKLVAFVFGPENGAVAERLVWEAAREAHAKNYAHLYVVGFAIQPPARQLVESCEQAIGIAATYVQATPDLMMGDLLKNMRSSQIFSVCGLPEVALRKAKPPAHVTAKDAKSGWYEVELLGLDVFDPSTMEVEHRSGSDVPAWFLDSNYNGLSFHVTQAFFPRTAAWDSLKRALKGEYEDSVWQHLAGTTSVPFELGEHREIAVKVVDDRGNELMVVKRLEDKK